MELSENLNKKLNQLCKKCNDFNKTIIKEFENLSNDIITINLFRSYYNSEDNINNNKRKENIIDMKEVENKISIADKRTSDIQGDNEIKEQEPSHRNEGLQRVCGEEEKKSDNVKKEKLIAMKIKPVNKEINEENTNSTLIKSRIKKIKINSKKHNNIIFNKNKAKSIKIIVLKEILSKTCNNRKDTKTLERNYKIRKKKKTHI
ncbi:hypothetical protein LY90DRAFT_513825 [Neocallimastix californiae]|uniref:Uncharacterized protein n=1 Tax=Neocallimastix californiae TaxID=1754190 RepID=A0A1Y2AUY9_9FUNG|nr:hypothetical protein LY90DRAFT_513825 [Neocallimastix californiae]|eukprot:ORY26296.1 hypothetical protein LY90DRAFT_513825 [Neocallimastix californiae]